MHHDTYAHVKFTVATSNRLGRDYLQENTVFDLELGTKVTRNVDQYPLYYVIYTAAQFEVGTSNCLGGDAFTGKYITCI